MTPSVRPPGAADRADIEELWTAASIVRERQGFALGAIFLAVLVPLWGVFDALLEPALLRPFLWLRAVDFVVGGALFVALVQSRGIREVRLFGWLRLAVSGVVIAFMCPRVSVGHFFPYILGFSLVFWAMGILHTFPIRFSVSLCATVLAAYFLARSLLGIHRPLVDEAAALFYLGSTTFMCILSVENRRRLYYETFLVNLELDARNHELDATVRSLRETQTRLVEGEKLSALGRLVASLSHGINNPINVLRNNLEPLASLLRTDAGFWAWLARAATSAPPGRKTTSTSCSKTAPTRSDDVARNRAHPGDPQRDARLRSRRRSRDASRRLTRGCGQPPTCSGGHCQRRLQSKSSARRSRSHASSRAR